MTIEAVPSLNYAEALTQQIRDAVRSVRDGIELLADLVGDAKRSEAWRMLGFDSWTAYLADVFASSPIRLDVPERRELVAYLRGEGLSTRAIAPIVGVTRQQVSSDLKVASDLPPAQPVTGLDGKTYAAMIAFARLDQSAAREFFDGVSEPYSLPVGDPRIALAKRFASIRRNGQKPKQYRMLGLITHAWNLWRRGAKVAGLQLPERIADPR